MSQASTGHSIWDWLIQDLCREKENQDPSQAISRKRYRIKSEYARAVVFENVLSMEGDMRISRFIPILISVCLIALTSPSAAQDAGIPDTVKIEGGPLVVGQSVPISITIVNDVDVPCYSLGLLLTSPENGFARYDSAVYVNRMADPAVMGFRIEVPRDTNGISPDSILLGAEKVIAYPLAPGNDPILLLYFTGLIHRTEADHNDHRQHLYSPRSAIHLLRPQFLHVHAAISGTNGYDRGGQSAPDYHVARCIAADRGRSIGHI